MLWAQADRLTKALRKGNPEAFANDQGELQLGGRFVWKKKIERELQGGARTKDIYERERMNTEAERKVSLSLLDYILTCLCVQLIIP